jgi:hypothetical protein
MASPKTVLSDENFYSEMVKQLTSIIDSSFSIRKLCDDICTDPD